MIALAADCILLRQSNGEYYPATSGAIAIEVFTEGESPFDEAFVKEASAAVLHYFKNEAGRESVTLGEFAEALEKVLKGFKFPASPGARDAVDRVLEADLQQLAAESGEAFELNFFPRLRDELRSQLRQSPQVLHFRGLRNCVKRLTGARRWTARCQSLQEQIVNFLRECLSAEPHPEPCALVVD
jgi:hypothetical protein